MTMDDRQKLRRVSELARQALTADNAYYQAIVEIFELVEGLKSDATVMTSVVLSVKLPSEDATFGDAVAELVGDLAPYVKAEVAYAYGVNDDELSVRFTGAVEHVQELSARQMRYGKAEA
jgi:hypothetical protein